MTERMAGNEKESVKIMTYYSTLQLSVQIVNNEEGLARVQYCKKDLLGECYIGPHTE